MLMSFKLLTASATPELHSSNTSLSDFVFFKVGAARFGEAGFGDAVYEDCPTVYNITFSIYFIH